MKLGIEQDEYFIYGQKPLVGLWLMIIGSVILLATLMDGTLFGQDFVIHPIVLTAGFGLGVLIVSQKQIKAKLTKIEQTAFQIKTARIGDTSLFILIFLFTAPFWPALNFTYIWLAAFLAVGMHFVFFYYSTGSVMLYLAGLTVLNVLIGYFILDFVITGVVDGIIKLLFGVYFFFFSKPTKKKNPLYKLG